MTAGVTMDSEAREGRMEFGETFQHKHGETIGQEVEEKGLGSVIQDLEPVPWVGVDLDGTLAVYDHWRGADHIGDPIPAMVERVKRWIAQGKCVKILTARVSMGCYNQASPAIFKWCKQHLGSILPITCEKDFYMEELWDDRAVSVEFGTGRVTTEGRG